MDDDDDDNDDQKTTTASGSPRRNILVTGATGKQGTALIKALLRAAREPSAAASSTAPQYHIYALTRHASGPAAARLRALSSPEAGGGSLTVVEGDLDVRASVAAVFDEAKKTSTAGGGGGGGIWGVFAVLAYPGLGAEADGEERQGKVLVDVALEFGVELFVYSSAARSGPRYEAALKLSSAAKREVEGHCREMGKTRGLNWVIIRPGFFMENFDGFIGSIAVSVLKSGLGEHTEIGLIAADDIGNVAAGVFKDPEKYRHQTLVAIGDFQTMSQLGDSYKLATGKMIPTVPRAMAWLITKTNKATQELIADLERHHHARVAGEYPELQAEIRLANEAFKMTSFHDWVKEGKRDQAVKEGWNGVSLGKLLTGQL